MDCGEEGGGGEAGGKEEQEEEEEEEEEERVRKREGRKKEAGNGLSTKYESYLEFRCVIRCKGEKVVSDRGRGYMVGGGRGN